MRNLLKRIKKYVLCILLVAAIAVTFTVVDVKVQHSYIDHGVANMVEDVMPAVVHILYRESEYGRAWQGSGVIISEDGLILTARHVVEKAGEFTVTLSDGREFVTKKACVSRNYDVGYLKIDTTNLPVVKFGDSDAMRLGSRLLAIGSPWGKQHFNSVTMGILSANNRDYSSEVPSYGWEVLFQTDVAANPGNSGGPVFNVKGEVVGIVVGSFGPGSHAGITYCVPSNVCESIIESVWMAFALQEVTLVEVDERMDAIEDLMNDLIYDILSVERRIDDIEFELDEYSVPQ